MRSSPIADLERMLCNICVRRYCIVTGRGATALYLAFKGLSLSGRKILFPAILCPSPPNAAIIAGFEPVFCDVSLDDATISERSVRDALDRDDEIAAVVVPHLYGNPARVQSICDFCSERSVRVIEDAAQLIGVSIDGEPVGSWGDCSILSFGHSKPLDCGGGGAVLTDNKEVYEKMRAEYRHIPEPTPGIVSLNALYRKTYYTLRGLTDLDERLSPFFYQVPHVFAPAYKFRITRQQAQKVLGRLGEIPRMIETRRRNAARYDEHLSNVDVRRLSNLSKGVPWRYTILVEHADVHEVTEYLRKEGFSASNWYPSLHRWYKGGTSEAEERLRNALLVEKTVLNLWVDETVNEDSIDRICLLIMKVLQDAQGA